MANGKVLGDDSKKAKFYGLANDDMVMLTSQRMMQAAGLGGAQMQQQNRPVAGGV
jgi:hypothetical protein